MEEINPSVQDILNELFVWAPPELAFTWDNPGHTIGDPLAPVTKVACALDASMESIEFARQNGAQLLITHHPLPLTPLKSIRSDSAVGRRVHALIRAGIAFISLHTNLDAAKGGVNDTLCRLLQLKEVITVEDAEGARLLRLGKLSPPVAFSSLVSSVKEILGAKALLCTGPTERSIKKLAVCGGSGGGYWDLARAHGADCLLTGELRHHDAVDARDEGFNMIAAGHFETERPVVYAMAQYLGEKAIQNDWKIQVVCFDQESSPIDMHI